MKDLVNGRLERDNRSEGLLYMDNRGGCWDLVILCDKIRSAEGLIMNHVRYLGYLFRSIDYFQCSKAITSFETNEMQHPY